jgi:hypothetical protein
MRKMIVDELPVNQGRPWTYPWNEWADLVEVDEYDRPCSKIRKLVQDEDRVYADESFRGSAQSFRVSAHRIAKSFGLKVETAIVDDGDAIIIRFYEPEA